MKIFVAALVGLLYLQSAATPQMAIDALMNAERQFADAARTTTAVPALTAMFADDVVMPVSRPAAGFARGKKAAVAALEANADNVAGRLSWWPVRGGVSADGQHGFTYGHQTLTRPDRSELAIKYVAYWVRTRDGWRVAVYKRVTADASPGTTIMAPAMPQRGTSVETDPALIAKHKASLDAAERAFSDEAQKIGLGPAFARHGRDDAVNVGPATSAGFVVGAVEIGRMIGGGATGPSPVRWEADEGSVVASSGDLGVTFGYIRQNDPAKQPGAVPFITIWKRDPGGPWRYIAE